MSIDLPAILAGMPSVTFTDVARLRLEVISFFLLGLLLSAGVVMAVWNLLRRDFTWLPRLTFGKSCGVVILWGLLFVVVLTMISGARELMTPGAWEKAGATYKLRAEPAQQTADASTTQQHFDRFSQRFSRLNSLFAGMVAYAGRTDGQYPETKEAAGLSAELWELPELPGTSYVLVPGLRNDGPARPLIYEPEVYDGEHFVLFTSGKIEQLPFAEIMRLAEAAP